MAHLRLWRQCCIAHGEGGGVLVHAAFYDHTIWCDPEVKCFAMIQEVRLTS